MIDLSQRGYTNEQVRKLLLSNRTISFRYELQDRFEKRLGDITARGYIYHDSNSTIARTAKLDIKDINDINILDERIQVFFRLHTKKEILEYPLGVFLISSPSNEFDGYSSTHDCECYDKTVVLKEDKFDKRYIVKAGTNYVTAITTILNQANFYTVNIQPSQLVLQSDLEFEIGTSKIDAINKLLDGINYNHLHFSETGIPTSEKYIDYSSLQQEEEYKTDDNSIISVPVKTELDTFNFPNKIVRYVENTEVGCIKSSYVNSDPANKLSTISRGRTIVDIDSVNNIADQVTLDSYVRKLAYEKCLYEIVNINTALMPHHSYNNCLFLDIPECNVRGKYIETSWSMNLEAGGSMSHTCKRIINV